MVAVANRTVFKQKSHLRMADRLGNIPGSVPIAAVAPSHPGKCLGGAVGGVCYSNTPPHTLHSSSLSASVNGVCDSAPRDLVTGGEDWFEVMVYLRWYPEDLDRLAKTLDAAAEEAAESKGAEPRIVGTLPGRGQWIVHSHGCKLGSGSKSVNMRWRFERDGVVFGLANRPEPHETLPSGFIRITGEILTAHDGAEGLWNRIVVWLHELGAELVEARVSRVDMAVDLPGVEVKTFVEAFRDGRYVSRTRKDTEWRASLHRVNKRDTGLSLGAGTMLRIYDKAIECQDLSKRAWIIARRWGEDQDHATRVEFQLRREFLKDHGVSTVDDYFAKRGQLARWLCTRWVRFVDGQIDRRHTERSKMMALWLDVIARFAAWTCLSPADLQRLPRAAVKVDVLVKQARGCFERAAALIQRSDGGANGPWQIDGQDDFLGWVTDVMWGVIKDDDRLAERVRLKCAGVM